MADNSDYVELGLSCAEVCRALARGMGKGKLDDLSMSVREAIAQLTTWVKSIMYVFKGSLMILIAALWPRSRRRSSRVVDGMQSPDLSMRGTTRERSLLGG